MTTGPLSSRNKSDQVELRKASKYQSLPNLSEERKKQLHNHVTEVTYKEIGSLSFLHRLLHAIFSKKKKIKFDRFTQYMNLTTEEQKGLDIPKPELEHRTSKY